MVNKASGSDWRLLLLGALLSIAALAAACGGDAASNSTETQSVDDWATGYCAIFDHYFSATAEQTATIDLNSGPLDLRLQNALAVAESQLHLLTEAADAMDLLVPAEAAIDQFQAEVAAALRADAQRVQPFVDQPPRSSDDISAMLKATSTIGDQAIEITRTSDKLSDSTFFTLVDHPTCAKWQ